LKKKDRVKIQLRGEHQLNQTGGKTTLEKRSYYVNHQIDIEEVVGINKRKRVTIGKEKKKAEWIFRQSRRSRLTERERKR